MNKCIFFDRDGVINVDFVDYVYDLEKFEFMPNCIEGIKNFKEEEYKLVVITNQSGIIKGIYDHKDVFIVHNHIQEHTGNAFDDMFYSPYHEKWSNSFTRKPQSLMWEKAISKHDVDIANSWMLGDKPRDLEPAKKLGIKTCLIGQEPYDDCDLKAMSVQEAFEKIKVFESKMI